MTLLAVIIAGLPVLGLRPIRLDL
ncbi:uncharacterized protein METZ01_LOCUS493568, partial [marine metagenome]